MQHQPPHQPVVYSSPPQSTESKASEAPPKQVALAMDRLSQAARLIADVRLGADRILEALFVAAQPHQSTKPLHLFAKEDAAMRQHFQDLRSIGRQLEESGVIDDSLRSRSNSWGLHMPVVCPDGAVVAYAWKRQLAGQAGASAVDRTRLAYKAFSDQKRRFFPHLDDGLNGQSSSSAPKRHRASISSHDEDATEYKTLSDVLVHLDKELSGVNVFTYDRLDWLKRSSSLPASTNENPMEVSKEQSFHSLNRLRTSSAGPSASDKVAIIELFCPSIFRAVVSLHPAGSTDPDAVAFFSADEGGSYVHSRGNSVHHVFKHINNHAETALQYFLGCKADTALYSILHWICSYQNLFTKVCSKCGRLLAVDKRSAVLLPPVNRSYSNAKAATSLEKAYHTDCYLDEQ